MAYECILTERFDGVAVITLNRPDKLNALSFPLVRELDDALTDYEADDDIKAVILTGAGERAFSAGADIHEMAGLSVRGTGARAARRAATISWHVASFAKPLIGAINGLAYGGAALMCSIARPAYRLRAHRIPLSGGELWQGQLDLVVAGAGRPAESEGAALYRARRRGRGGRAHRAAQPGRAGSASSLDTASRWDR